MGVQLSRRRVYSLLMIIMTITLPVFGLVVNGISAAENGIQPQGELSISANPEPSTEKIWWVEEPPELITVEMGEWFMYQLQAESSERDPEIFFYMAPHPYFSIDSSSGRIINKTFLDYGLYRIFVAGINSQYDKVIAYIYISITDTVTPVINGPENHEFDDENVSLTLQWKITDWTIFKYELQKDGEDLLSERYEELQINPSITIETGNLAAGRYIYTLSVYDAADNQAVDSVIIQVGEDDTTTEPFTPASTGTTTPSNPPTELIVVAILIAALACIMVLVGVTNRR